MFLSYLTISFCLLCPMKVFRSLSISISFIERNKEMSVWGKREMTVCSSRMGKTAADLLMDRPTESAIENKQERVTNWNEKKYKDTSRWEDWASANEGE